jgi:DNA-binding NarL/FixJ family response regulator
LRASRSTVKGRRHEQNMSKTRIVLADDHPIVLDGLRNLIAAETDFELVGEAASGLAALKLIREKRPDVAVLDISMPEINGIVLSRRLAGEIPGLRVLVLTLHEDRAYLNQALEAGVRGYVLKRSAVENLVQAIRAVTDGGVYVDPSIPGRTLNGKRPQSKPAQRGAAPALTERETAVLKMTALGFTNKEIASRLDVGVKSVETYKARGFEKLGLKTRAELVRYASAQGWLEAALLR